MSHFEQLASVNVNDQTEKKGKFTYLSWAWAVDNFSRYDPMATWEYPPPVTFPDDTMMVFCSVTSNGLTRTAQLPVMEQMQGKGMTAVVNPNAMEINKAMQRCLAKAFALHGLGLYIYVGEDIPSEVVDVEYITESQVADLDGLISDVGANKEGLLVFLKIKNLEDLPAGKYEYAVSCLEAKRASK